MWRVETWDNSLEQLDLGVETVHGVLGVLRRFLLRLNFDWDQNAALFLDIGAYFRGQLWIFLLEGEGAEVGSNYQVNPGESVG